MPTNSRSTLEDEAFSDFDPDLVRLLFAAAVAGALTGLLGGAFRWALEYGSGEFLDLLAYLKQNYSYLTGILVAMAMAGTSIAIARWLIRYAPWAAGSGVQHIEAVMREQSVPASLLTLPVKFFGGLLAIVPGLALGREGPTIQMAAVLGSAFGRIFRLPKADLSLLYTAVAGSGLSVAFNAPLAGAAFVIEEVAHRVTVRRLLATMTAVAFSMAVFRTMFGNDHDFIVGALSATSNPQLVVYLVMGMLLGALGVLYNRFILSGLDAFSNVAPGLRPWVKAGLVGLLVGIIAYFQPNWVGGGERQVNMLLAGQFTTQALLVLLVVRWIIGPVSYSLGAPGGVFAPLLFVGGIIGVLFAQGIDFVTDSAFGLQQAAVALIAMSAFFTGVVRAPITGILLICEMSGTVSLMIPLLLANVGSAMTASLLRGAPLYDTLRIRMLTNASKKT